MSPERFHYAQHAMPEPNTPFSLVNFDPEKGLNGIVLMAVRSPGCTWCINRNNSEFKRSGRLSCGDLPNCDDTAFLPADPQNIANYVAAKLAE